MWRVLGWRVLAPVTEQSGSAGPDCRPACVSWSSILLGNAPKPDFGPPFSCGGLLVGAHQGAVEHQILVLAIRCERLEDPFPNARFGPAREALVERLPLAVALGQVVPMGTRPQHP